MTSPTSQPPCTCATTVGGGVRFACGGSLGVLVGSWMAIKGGAPGWLLP